MNLFYSFSLIQNSDRVTLYDLIVCFCKSQFPLLSFLCFDLISWFVFIMRLFRGLGFAYRFPQSELGRCIPRVEFSQFLGAPLCLRIGG